MDERFKEVAVDMLLEAYFAKRSSRKPEKDNYIEEKKTSFEIAQEMSEMCTVTTDDVAAYMVERGFSIVMAEDGTPRWLFYRKVDDDN